MYCIYNSCINVFKKSGSIIYIDISKNAKTTLRYHCPYLHDDD